MEALGTKDTRRRTNDMRASFRHQIGIFNLRRDVSRLRHGLFLPKGSLLCSKWLCQGKNE
jgi:hypothetical protein